MSWTNALSFFSSHIDLVDLYYSYRNDKIDNNALKSAIKSFCRDNEQEILDILGGDFKDLPCILIKEVETNLSRKMQRMKVLEKERRELPLKDINDNIETAIKSAVYMNYRYLYNDNSIRCEKEILHCALFFFIRNYAYSGMFRYSSKGEFNVPYGGIAYNSKLMEKKLSYYKTPALLNHFSNTRIYNMDFEKFLRSVNPSENDFVFLDPPYDSEFSTYAQNAFTRDDQIRLANYMINDCKAKWMLIIKNTDFIYSLYNKEGINIRTFDKEYLVSFMNRNDKKVTHLLITNY
jgi:DNA adenine methylase